MYQCFERSANHVITRDITCNIQQMLILGYNLSLQSLLNFKDCTILYRILGVAGPQPKQLLYVTRDVTCDHVIRRLPEH